ncbi:MAG: hypothetical protein LBD40_01785 [Puniceicoccales bacterium]|jgi:mRNA-degrading endonuclease RelE of RelBE toxin-antitoxin system|nr:hypothetical protein [Puniceicoccales bacterium]
MAEKYNEIPEFEKDFKKLLKRFYTLREDIENMKKSLLEPYFSQKILVSGVPKMEGFCGENYASYKVKSFACAALKGKGRCSGMRIILVYHKEEREITFIEIYFKGNRKNGDKERLQVFIKNLQ